MGGEKFWFLRALGKKKKRESIDPSTCMCGAPSFPSSPSLDKIPTLPLTPEFHGVFRKNAEGHSIVWENNTNITSMSFLKSIWVLLETPTHKIPTIHSFNPPRYTPPPRFLFGWVVEVSKAKETRIAGEHRRRKIQKKQCSVTFGLSSWTQLHQGLVRHFFLCPTHPCGWGHTG